MTLLATAWPSLLLLLVYPVQTKSRGCESPQIPPTCEQRGELRKENPKLPVRLAVVLCIIVQWRKDLLSALTLFSVISFSSDADAHTHTHTRQCVHPILTFFGAFSWTESLIYEGGPEVF